MEMLYLLPAISNKENVLYKIYHFLNMLNRLKNKHPLVPIFDVSLISKSDIVQIKTYVTSISSYTHIKNYLDDNQFQNRIEESLFELELALNTDIDIEKESKSTFETGLIDFPFASLRIEFQEFIQSMMNLNKEHQNFHFPIPYIQKNEYFLIDEVTKQLNQKNIWLVQIIEFFQFITEFHYEVTEDILPTDFYFSSKGELEMFIAFDKLRTSQKSNTELLLTNMKKFKEFIKDYAANYFYQVSKQNFNSDMNTFISKVVTQNQRHSTFQEVLDDFHNQLERSPREKRVGVFIDYANLFTGIDPLGDGTGVKVHFKDLLSILYDHDFTKRLTVKYAVVFQATYESLERMEFEQKRVDKIRSYLIKEEIEPKTVSNGTEKAKEINNGVEFDKDDNELITKMRQNLHSLDEIILFSGDQHFIEVIKEYKNLQKTVKVIAVEHSTSKELRELVDDYRCISNYWNCLEYSFEEESQWVTF
jgi:uncharacterized LabA/DUF88 family protein